MTDIPFYWLDIFTSEPFKGNPAAVLLMKTDLEDKTYLNIANELGLTETAFTEKIGESEYRLRWFTPRGEVPMCGYATIATAYTLAKEYGVGSPISFHTMSGVLPAEINEDQVTINFPLYPLIKKTEDERLLEPLGVKNYVELRCSDTPLIFMVELENHEQVSKLNPDPSIRNLLKEMNAYFIIATARGKKPFDYVHRVFNQGGEDHGCGVAHCALGPYWQMKLGKSKMRSLQPTERGSEIFVELTDDATRITGSAKLLIKGTLSI